MIQAFLLAGILFTGPDAVEAAREYRRAHGAEILQEFSILLAIPNVVSDDLIAMILTLGEADDAGLVSP